MADVKWIKITTDIFDDEKIRLIDAMPDRDAILVMWFKLLTLAGKTNANGLVYIMEKVPTTDEMLATIFGRPLNTVRLALKVFSDLNMIEIKEHINIVNWEKHQNVSGLERIKEQNKIRQRKFKEKNKLAKGNVTSNVISNVTKTLPGNVTITLGNATDIDIDKNIDIDIDYSTRDKDTIDTNSLGYIQENNIHNNNTCRVSDETATTDLSVFEIIINFLNKQSERSFRIDNKSTVRLINARLKEGYTVNDFKLVIKDKCSEWKDDPKMKQYLQPTTLFAPTKFENYLVKAKENRNSSRRRNRKSGSGVVKIK